MTIFKRAIMSGILLVCIATQAVAEKRIALVIGNDTYQHLPPYQQLQKARNDARAAAKAFRELGFEVMMALDLGRSSMHRQLQEFANRISPGDTASFFFAGHGVRIEGRNYLLPSDVPQVASRQEHFLRAESVGVDTVVDMIRARGARLSLLILDACRNNPFVDEIGRSVGAKRGLAQMDPPEGTLILFSAGAGQEALDRLSDGDPHPNSIFTRTLLPLLTQKGQELSTLTRRVKRDVRALARTVNHVQTPAVYNEVIGDVYLAGKPVVVASPAPSTLPPPSPPPAPIPQASTPAGSAGGATPSNWREVKLNVALGVRAGDGGKPSLGVNVRSLTEELSNALQFPSTKGAFVDGVADDGAARRAGIIVGDTIIRVGSAPVEGARELARLIGGLTAGQRIEIVIRRFGNDSSDLLRRLRERAEAGHGHAALALGRMLGRSKAAGGGATEAARWYRKAADSGNHEAMYELARLHEVGSGVDKSAVEAVRWYRMSAEKGETRAMNALGSKYLHGRGVEQNDSEAARWYSEAAKKGYARAAANIGYMYANGRGVDRSLAQALRWYRTGAEAGDARSMNNLGVMYEHGRGVEKSYTEAVRWYRKGAETGDGLAMANLGMMYASGRGVEKNVSEAMRWLRMGADKGDTRGMNNLGVIYQHGRGVEKNQAEAVSWYRKAADKGDARAMINLGVMYEHGFGVEKSHAEAVSWYRKSAEKGDPLGMVNLGVMYQHGRGLTKNSGEAVRWYRKGADVGNPRAMTNLGWMYDNGLGIGRNQGEAARWYRKAAEAGNATAMTNLGLLYERGKGVERSATNAAHWLIESIHAGGGFAIRFLQANGRDIRPETRRAIQIRLKERGFYAGPIDGDLGPSTQRAMQALLEQGRSGRQREQ